MPFVQMENISLFLKACQAPPLGMHAHDVFLTVDLYERKDPAQVIQCIAAFSRRANEVQPDRFPRTIGPKTRGPSVGGPSTPQRWGSLSTDSAGGRDRAVSNTSMGSSSTFNASSRLGYDASEGGTPTSSPSSRSNGGSATKVKGSWSQSDTTAAPAWNIHQYGYMGGASQGNQGITFGGRRQITSPAPRIPSLAEKEKKRKEELADQERRHREMEEAEQRERAEREVEEERERALEAQRWEEATRKLREEEARVAADEERQRRVDEERRHREREERAAAERQAEQLEEMNRQIQEDEERRRRQRQEAEARRTAERSKSNLGSDLRLQGQFLSDYQAEERRRSMAASAGGETTDRALHDQPAVVSPVSSYSHGRPQYSLQHSPTRAYHTPQAGLPPSPTRQRLRDSLDSDSQYAGSLASPPPASSRPLPDPTPVQVKTNTTGPSSRPLPDPTSYVASNRTDQFLASHPAPVAEKPKTYLPNEFSFDSSAERDMEDERRRASQAKTQAGAWASKSLLEREMEKERQRQQEWEEAQRATQDTAHGLNRGGAAPGGRRGFIGPRPPP